jgi:predicted metalloprotease with PDZ domain
MEVKMKTGNGQHAALSSPQIGRKEALIWRQGLAWLGLLMALWNMGSRASGAAQNPIDYQIDLREPSSHLARVTMTVRNAAPGARLQFPAWNALYQIRDFVRNVQQLQAKCGGEDLNLVAVDLETWRTRHDRCNPLTVTYAVYSNQNNVFSSELSERHAFLNLADLLFYLPDERSRPVKARFLLPAGWKMATLLPLNPQTDSISAPDYDQLVDSPVEAGNFQSYQFEQGPATYRVIVRAYPEDYSPEKLVNSVEQITAEETALMKDVPFKQYTFIFHFPRQGAGGGMEHALGTAISFPVARIKSDWAGLESTVAHEFFHLWNVKRIRPQGLEPVDYVHGNDTRDLWFSEGVTSTFGELTLERSHLISRQDFFDEIGRQIQELESRPARHFQSVELSGMDAWLEKYPDYFRPERSISYYNKGELLGYLLDLGIRHASASRHSLSDLMRTLNVDFAQRGRCFTDADLENILSSLAGSRDWVEQFFHDAVDGTEGLDYQTYLGYAGLQLAEQVGVRPDFGFRAERASDGLIRVATVNAGSEAAKAGLEAGDILLKINGLNLVALPDNVAGVRPGHRVKFTVRRRGQTFEVKYHTGSIPQKTYAIVEMRDAAPAQRALREGWLAGKEGRGAALAHP